MDSSKFVIREIIKPVVDEYNKTKNINNSFLIEDKYNDLKKAHSLITNANTVISQFKKTGDLYKYIKHSISKADKSTKLLQSLSFKTFEDIINEFEQKFKNELYNCSSIDELNIDDIYSTWDVLFLTNTYRLQTPRILGVVDKTGKVFAVTAKGKFTNNDQGYKNEYLNHDKSKVKYYLIKKYDHKYNKYITNQHLDVYLFETIDENKQLFKGIFELESFDENNNFVILNKKKKQNEQIISIDEVISNHKPKYRNKYIISEKTNGGSSETGRAKERAGQRAENSVSNFLSKHNIGNSKTSEKGNHIFDIKINELTNLEVKNISNVKAFYLSYSQINEFKKSNTRICLVDIDKNTEYIYISKPYAKSNVLKKIMNDIEEIKLNVISKYNGKYKIDSIEIGLIKPENDLIEDIYKDFILINNLNQSEIISFLKG